LGRERVREGEVGGRKRNGHGEEVRRLKEREKEKGRGE